jgi:hypothetical protein
MAEDKKVCGVIMPISAIDGCSEEHWAEVLDIVSDAIEEADMEANLVSNADEVGIIQKRIIQNVYDNPIVVCDVSGKNANVMFELGMRLAFDKPTIIVKDDKTSYSFDTAIIEHLDYPRDLRFAKIVEFKQQLTEKIVATSEKASEDPTYSTFLKQFGDFKTAILKKTEVPAQDFILEELKNLRQVIEKSTIRPRQERRRVPPVLRAGQLDVCMRSLSDEQIEQLMKAATSYPGLKAVRLQEKSPDHKHILVDSDKNMDLSPLKDLFLSNIPNSR